MSKILRIWSNYSQTFYNNHPRDLLKFMVVVLQIENGFFNYLRKILIPHLLILAQNLRRTLKNKKIESA